MVVNADACVSGVTPAQQRASTVTSISGNAALIISAFETTHMSVQSPIISTSLKSNLSQSVYPKLGLFI